MTCEICGSTKNVENATFNGPENETEYFSICAKCNGTETEKETPKSNDTLFVLIHDVDDTSTICGIFVNEADAKTARTIRENETDKRKGYFRGDFIIYPMPFHTNVADWFKFWEKANVTAGM